MVWKTLFFAFLAVGVLAEYEVSEENRNALKDMLTKTCTKYGAADKVADVEKSAQDFINCLKTIVNTDTLKKEIEEAKPNGALDEVFKKYCGKSDQLKTCIHNLSTGITPCIEPGTRERIPEINNGADKLIDFICFKDGDRIALFIAEEGPECFKSKMNELRQCFESVKGSVASVEQAKALTLQEQCAKYDTFSKCVVEELEKCDTPTPGNMAESMLRYVRNGSPCAKKQS